MQQILTRIQQKVSAETRNFKYQSFKNLGIYKILRRIETSGKPNAIFVWIPKNAGSSVFNLLNQYCIKKSKSLNIIEESYINKGINTFGHMDLRRLINEGFVDQRYYEDAFKFAFTRNPYCRSVSLFNYLLRKGHIPRKTFLEFTRSLNKENIEDICLQNRKGLSMCNPQHRWLQDININHLGSIETLNEDIKEIFKQLNLSENTTQEQRNKSTFAPYDSFYCKESQENIYNYYKVDFEKYGYSEELENLKNPPIFNHKL